MRRRLLWPLLLVLALGGCSLAGSLHLGDVTLALHHGFHAFGSHVAIGLH